MFSYFIQIDLFGSFSSIRDWFFALLEGQISPPPLALPLLLLSLLIIYAIFWMFRRRRRQTQPVKPIISSVSIQSDRDDTSKALIEPESIAEDSTSTSLGTDDIEAKTVEENELQVASKVEEPDLSEEPAQSNSTMLYLDPHLALPVNNVAGLPKRKTLSKSTIRRWQKAIRAKAA